MEPTIPRLFTHADRPDLQTRARLIKDAAWPRFMLEDETDRLYSPRLYTDFPEFQVYLVGHQENLLGLGHSIPFSWDHSRASLPDEGWDAVLRKGVDDRDRGISPNTLSALEIVIEPTLMGTGLSRLLIDGFRSLALRSGFEAFVAPVRPNRKAMYPLTPMARYVRWTRDDGAPRDPWIRTHWRAGAVIVRVCPKSMLITGSTSDWETWTGLEFPDNGSYVVPGALVPIEVDRDADLGRYVEPNVWMRHRLG